MKRRTFLLTFAALLLGSLPAFAQRQQPGIVGQPAPAWGVTDWLNLPPNARALDVADLRGKVVYLYGFQSWCPGCHKVGFPTLKTLLGKYADDAEVAFVAVQTTFEGFGSNGFAQARQTAARYGLTIPVGQSGTAQQPSALMRNYRTGGTPWVIIIDRRGVVRFNDFHIAPQQAVQFMDALKAER